MKALAYTGALCLTLAVSLAITLCVRALGADEFAQGSTCGITAFGTWQLLRDLVKGGVS